MTRPQFVRYIKSLGFLYNNKDKVFEFQHYSISTNKMPIGMLDICLIKSGELIHDSCTYLDMYGYIEYTKLFKNK